MKESSCRNCFFLLLDLLITIARKSNKLYKIRRRRCVFVLGAASTSSFVFSIPVLSIRRSASLPGVDPKYTKRVDLFFCKDQA